MNYYAGNRRVIGILERLRLSMGAARFSRGEGHEQSGYSDWVVSLRPGLQVSRIGLEAGPLSQWLYTAMKEAGLAVELLETRHVRNAFKTMAVKTDRKDARGIAELNTGSAGSARCIANR